MTSAKAGKRLVSATTIVISTWTKNWNWACEGRPMLVLKGRRRRKGSGLGDDFVNRRRGTNRYNRSDEAVRRRAINVEVRQTKFVKKIVVGVGVTWFLEPWFEFNSNFFAFFEFEKRRKPFSLVEKAAERTRELERNARFAEDKVFEVAIRLRIGKRQKKTFETILSGKRERIATPENRAELVCERESRDWYESEGSIALVEAPGRDGVVLVSCLVEIRRGYVEKIFVPRRIDWYDTWLATITMRALILACLTSKERQSTIFGADALKRRRS